MKEKLKILFELTKIKITLFVTITTAFGFISAAGNITAGIIAPVAGILLLACGSAAVNHFQERETDAMMERTKNRPIPSGRISPQSALYIALILIISGSVILYEGAGILALGLGLLNLLWYNGIYTPLKRHNALAIIPGSMVGAIPPVVGWAAAGGNIFDPQILIIAFFFFIWQIPHFWLLLLILSKDYEQAGFPTLTKTFNQDQLSRITFMWISATGITGILIPLFGIIKFPLIDFVIFLSSLWLIWKATKLLKNNKGKKSFGFAFRAINIFALLVVILLSIDKLVFLS
ncbi:MAG: protoheme IX farnesyltransferase [Ignavibacteriaceae bacterium]